MPPKKYGWSGYHSRVIQKKKKILDPYLGIIPNTRQNPQLPYTPDQYYALRRMQLQMSLLNLSIKKKRGMKVIPSSLLTPVRSVFRIA